METPKGLELFLEEVKELGERSGIPHFNQASFKEPDEVYILLDSMDMDSAKVVIEHPVEGILRKYAGMVSGASGKSPAGISRDKCIIFGFDYNKAKNLESWSIICYGYMLE